MIEIKALPSKTQCADELSDLLWENGIEATVRSWNNGEYITIECPDSIEFDIAVDISVFNGWGIQYD